MLYLSDNKFWYSGGQTTMKAFRAYFNFADKSIGMDATRVAITIDDDATSIDAINGLESSCEAVFSLQGQRVAAPVKGVYVRNGKKIVIK
jgi:hypothetical protein